MIDFRYHLVSIVSIFFALAVGIALGAGPLRGPVARGLESRSDQDRAATEELRAEAASAADGLDYFDAYAAGTSSTVLGARLSGRTVGLVTLPGSDPGDVRALARLVATAGGTVVSTVAWTAEMLDPANRQLADELAGRLLDGTSGAAQPGSTGSYPLLGAAYARAFLTSGGLTLSQDSDAEGIEAALGEAGFLRIDGQADRRAQLALLVAGDPVADAAGGQADVTAELAAALAAGSLGVVVAGTPDSADDGAVGAVRRTSASRVVSTVDAVDLPAGRVSAVLALAEQSTGGVGQYGLVDADDGALPLTGGAG